MAAFAAILLTTGLSEKPLPDRDPKNKFVGSEATSIFFHRMPTDTLTDMVYFSTNVVIGTVEKYSVYEGEMPFDDKISTPYSCVLYDVKVEKTLYGEHNDMITISLWGQPNNDNGVTKPRIGERMVFFVGGPHPVGGTYSLVAAEKAMFSINRNETVLSLSESWVSGQFDGKPLEFLIEEIEKAVAEYESGEWKYGQDKNYTPEKTPDPPYIPHDPEAMTTFIPD